MISEDELVRAIKKVLSGEAPGVVVPIGDDAAVVDPGKHHAVLTVDTMVEDVHFDPAAAQAHDIGHKAVTINVSDIAAMGASPAYGVVSLGLAPDARPPWVMELFGGMREAADEYGVSLVGGDTVRADRTVITVAVLGRVAEGRAVRRAGARPGDRLVVTGALGAAAGGLRLVRAPSDQLRASIGTDWERALMGALVRPVARVGEGGTLAQAGATAMIDISDGLALDLSRLCEAGGVGARVRLEDVPLAEGLGDLTAILEEDPLDLALHGGEDYELLAALPTAAVEEARSAMADRFRTPLTVIGEVTESGLVAVEADGTERPLEPRGWDHFA